MGARRAITSISSAVMRRPWPSRMDMEYNAPSRTRENRSRIRVGFMYLDGYMYCTR